MTIMNAERVEEVEDVHAAVLVGVSRKRVGEVSKVSIVLRPLILDDNFPTPALRFFSEDPSEDKANYISVASPSPLHC